MATTSAGHIVRESVGWTIALSVLLMISGLLAIVVPPAAGIATAIVVAWLILLGGILHFVYAWHLRSTKGMGWELLLGALYVALGVYMLIRPVASLLSLTLVLACYLVAKAIVEFVLANRLRILGGTRWLVLDGIVSLVLGGMIAWTWPRSSEWAIGTLVGLSIFFAGTSRLSLALTAKKVAAALP